jgi:hypothetical protein
MQYLQNINLDTIIIVYAGIKNTNLVLSDIGLINYNNGKIYKKQLNSGCYGYFINRKFKAESKLNKYPITKILIIKQKLPF